MLTSHDKMPSVFGKCISTLEGMNFDNACAKCSLDSTFLPHQPISTMRFYASTCFQALSTRAPVPKRELLMPWCGCSQSKQVWQRVRAIVNRLKLTLI